MLSVDFANIAQQRFKGLHFTSAPALASMNQGAAGDNLANVATQAGRPAKYTKQVKTTRN